MADSKKPEVGTALPLRVAQEAAEVYIAPPMPRIIYFSLESNIVFR